MENNTVDATVTAQAKRKPSSDNLEGAINLISSDEVSRSELILHTSGISQSPSPVDTDRDPLTTMAAEDVEQIEHEIDFDALKLVDTRGHFCDLFLGTHRRLGKIALKRLRQQGGGAEHVDTLVRHFQRKTGIWMGLRHERILRCLGTIKREGHLYIVSPFMSNGTLFDWIRSKKHVGIERLRLIHELCDALVYVHSSGIVHGDVKANNVLISDDLHVQLCDFGLTKLAASGTTTTLKGAGSVRWQSPELWNDEPKTFASDVYAFSMTMVEVLTGKVPFANLTLDFAVAMAVHSRDERPARAPEISPDGTSYASTWDLVELCWVKVAGRRISMAEAAKLLNVIRHPPARHIDSPTSHYKYSAIAPPHVHRLPPFVPPRAAGVSMGVSLPYPPPLPRPIGPSRIVNFPWSLPPPRPRPISHSMGVQSPRPPPPPRSMGLLMGVQSPRPPPPLPPRPPRLAIVAGPGVPRYKSLHNFTGQKGEISLSKGDIVRLLKKGDNRWWLVKRGDEEGWAPSNYFELATLRRPAAVTTSIAPAPEASSVSKGVSIDASPPPSRSPPPSSPSPATVDAEPEVPQYKAVYDFAGKEGEISFAKGDIVGMVEGDDNGECTAYVSFGGPFGSCISQPPGWWLVTKGDQEGWAPSNYLELIPSKPEF